MIVKKRSEIRSSEITPRRIYLRRRDFIRGAAALALGTWAWPFGRPLAEETTVPKLGAVRNDEFSVDEPLTSREEATTYNNFYEFSTQKRGIPELSRDFRTRPWTLTVDGEVQKPKTYDIDDLMRMFTLEERVYRLRCVEAWSMVIPWDGFPLAGLIRLSEPTSRAAFVEFTAVHAPDQMPGQKSRVLKWPYREGLRMDEALHPLALLAVGMYGEPLPNQNGAPIRLVVPWKYGFKSIKSVVRIRLTDSMPRTTWVEANPREYGFYANVNSEVRHPRWTQARERRVGESGRRPTLMFNGYSDQVAGLYAGMDLKKYY